MRRVGQLPVSGSMPFHFLSLAHMKGLVILAFNVSRDSPNVDSIFDVKSYDNDSERQRMKSVFATLTFELLYIS